MIVLIKGKIIDILNRIILIQDDIRLSSFLMQFNKYDNTLIMNPVKYNQVMTHLSNINNGIFEETEESLVQKQQCDEMVIQWLKVSFKNKNLDMRAKSTKKDLICILLDIILYQDSKLVNSAFTLLSKYFKQQESIFNYAYQVQLL